jgi:hypothetical protein
MPRRSSVNRGLSNTTVPVELATPSTVRCAIYTRKSTEEGLQQEFNSLDAQREAAEAFIRSQKNEGWELLPDLYDDGGYTGGNMDRPALQRLIDDTGQKFPLSATTPVGGSLVEQGGKLLRYINLPQQWTARAGSGFDTFLIEGYQYPA